MALLNIVKLGDEVLRKRCREVTEITPKILTLLDDMRDTLIHSGGVGLAAPQVGILRRIFIIDVGVEEGKNEIIEFINPQIVEKKGHQEEIEGCLSIPGKCGVTKRPKTVTVEAQDRNGNTFRYTGSDLYGRCLCHENDHLDGILYIDHATEVYDEED